LEESLFRQTAKNVAGRKTGSRTLAGKGSLKNTLRRRRKIFQRFIGGRGEGTNKNPASDKICRVKGYKPNKGSKHFPLVPLAQFKSSI
jgi:hypothetical protein